MATAQSDAQKPLEANPGDQDTRPHGSLMRFSCVSGALVALLACPAWAARWIVVPTLLVEETYTDNVALESDALKRGDWVTQVVPGISIAALGARAQFNINYAPALIYYAQGEADNKVFQQLNATGNAELAKQLLFVDVGAFMNPVNISLQDPLSATNVNATGNLATAKTFFGSPYIRHDFGSAVRGEARFTYSALDYDDAAGLPNSDADRADLKLSSGPAHKLLTWDLALSRDKTYYDTQPDTLAEQATANARLLIIPTVGLMAQSGYESYDTGLAGSDSEGPRWSAGFDWTPTSRTHLAATAGRRFFGSAYWFDFRHRSRLTAWSAGYSEDVSSTLSESFAKTAGPASYLDPLFLSSIPDPVARQKAVDEIIVQTGLPPGLGAPTNFASSQPYLLKRGQASVSLLGARNILIANAYTETRETLDGNAVATGDFAASSTIKQAGTSLAWSWRLTAQNTSTVRAGYTRNEFPDIDRVDDLKDIRVGLTRRFQPRLSGSLFYRWQQNDSNQGAFNYTENAVTATLRMRF